MPIYGYVCKSCGHRFDVLQKMSDDPLVHCPDCAEPTLQKELSAPKFRLKGKGWYETDFKTGDQRNLHAGDSDNKPKETAKKADKKPDAKAASD
ncbi:MAG: zinc ribbon domain-containing protein [Gammaproteobacteria bacterium]|nr:zinc ribbon domain-containing protein [Gammaproteobacteria bacterium]